MIPIAVLGVIEQALRAYNNFTEGKSSEQRRAEALIAFALFKPLLWPFLPEETKAEIDKLMPPPE